MPPPLTLRDILRPGIAGYSSPSNPVSFIDATGELKAFRRAVHAAAVAVSGRVTRFAYREPGSYYVGTIESRGRAPEHILRHTILPYITFVADPDAFNLHFIRGDRLAPFFPPPLIILPPDLLESPLPLDEATLTSLDQADRSAIKAWQPRRVGDLIFNWFD